MRPDKNPIDFMPRDGALVCNCVDAVAVKLEPILEN
tara:strand:+ start:613 stop:720 length:108 start_codon:yes stop_codon:yes gene_type:complete